MIQKENPTVLEPESKVQPTGEQIDGKRLNQYFVYYIIAL